MNTIELFYNLWYKDGQFILERKDQTLKIVDYTMELFWAEINPPAIGIKYL